MAASDIAATQVLATMVGGHVRFGTDRFPAAKTDTTELAAALSGKETP